MIQIFFHFFNSTFSPGPNLWSYKMNGFYIRVNFFYFFHPILFSHISLNNSLFLDLGRARICKNDSIRDLKKVFGPWPLPATAILFYSFYSFYSVYSCYFFILFLLVVLFALCSLHFTLYSLLLTLDS